MNKDTYQYTYDFLNPNISPGIDVYGITEGNDSLVVFNLNDSFMSNLKKYYKVGDTVYVTAYGCNYYQFGGDYFDADLNRWVYTSLNDHQSNTIYFIVE